MLEDIWNENGRPEYMFLDFRPIQYPILLVTTHDLAEQVVRATKARPYSVTKSPTVQGEFGALVGKQSMLTQNDGEAWKALRKQFNPGFAPQHLVTLLPVIVDKTRIFMEKLDAAAKSGAVTEMEGLCVNCTFDIIGEVITNVNSHAQEDELAQGNDFLRNFRLLSETYVSGTGLGLAAINPLTQAKRYFYSRRMDAALHAIIRDKFNAIQQSKKTSAAKTKDRSVLALALQDVNTLTPHITQVVADQCKTFLFAGHDTTSILLQRLIYALSIHPACLAKLRAEHDLIFGAQDPGTVFLTRPDETLKQLTYTSACIKEALRLWPPAATARMSHDTFTLHTSLGESVLVDDCVIYPIQHIIHRDPHVYGASAADFVPERWLGDADTSMATNTTSAAHADIDADAEHTGTQPTDKIPPSAWRPFERGPRNCIGQELANLEARVILACVMGRYEFVKVGVGEVQRDGEGRVVVDGKGSYKTVSELISVSLRFLVLFA